MPGHFDPVHQASDYVGAGFHILAGHKQAEKGGGEVKK